MLRKKLFCAKKVTTLPDLTVAFWQQAMVELNPLILKLNSSSSLSHAAGIKMQTKGNIIRLSFMEHKLCIFWSGDHHQAGGEDAQSEDQVTRPAHHGGQGV
jgi:hypothetical protein